MIKKAFLISFIIQAVIVGWIILLGGDHSALTFGMLLQFPASMAGALIGQMLQSSSGTKEISLTVAVIITVLLQFFLLSWIIYFIIKRRNKKI
jgi:hypothetical protein